MPFPWTRHWPCFAFRTSFLTRPLSRLRSPGMRRGSVTVSCCRIHARLQTSCQFRAFFLFSFPAFAETDNSYYKFIICAVFAVVIHTDRPRSREAVRAGNAGMWLTSGPPEGHRRAAAISRSCDLERDLRWPLYLAAAWRGDWTALQDRTTYPTHAPLGITRNVVPSRHWSSRVACQNS